MVSLHSNRTRMKTLCFFVYASKLTIWGSSVSSIVSFCACCHRRLQSGNFIMNRAITVMQYLHGVYYMGPGAKTHVLFLRTNHMILYMWYSCLLSIEQDLCHHEAEQLWCPTQDDLLIFSHGDREMHWTFTHKAPPLLESPSCHYMIQVGGNSLWWSCHSGDFLVA